ncbi:TetR/AcrR family transcriptional regulator [Motilimonas pumila]|uniref:TetR/AcrR family transcriptional regulator n=1 Tax=Motilimonas pumila TaxID=2303987 RepID=A0A418Y939_9GAMM|nr:TetR/AcrR family transcriptional regulator [Motilimonas pumila]RJG36132.1 TetR/AcrR family transcriptional regulator [Motilimonas pumila]
MSGKKQFNEQQALDAAMRVFWEKGFAATSMAELEAATKLNKSSLYNTFGNKEALYGKSLEHFRTQYTERVFQQLAHPDLAQALNDVFSRLIAGFESPNCPSGCIATMAALEMNETSKDIAQLVAKGIDDTLQALTQRLSQGIADKQLPPETAPQELASMIVAVTRGVIVLNMGTGNSLAGHQAYRQLLRQLNIQALPKT